MKVDVNVTHSVTFKKVNGGESFLYSGNAYIKLMDFIYLADRQPNPDGATKEVGGFNAVRLEDGRPGSFQTDTKVVPKGLMVVASS